MLYLVKLKLKKLQLNYKSSVKNSVFGCGEPIVQKACKTSLSKLRSWRKLERTMEATHSCRSLRELWEVDYQTQQGLKWQDQRINIVYGEKGHKDDRREWDKMEGERSKRIKIAYRIYWCGGEMAANDISVTLRE